ncbi:putative sugar phosphate/phosphate translocator-like [Dorcoceras hygrometricum]|uniref:Putative sugar phosphate/phosphate translocator-like n=1 Tax=Dorcoceras hygrometricum TaxID=472368 RepID=A0A2Z7D834_9LAMI|nr:putative sugar phosphate/phosphate translocator-like [Dorcoceras hygrometricum]
MSCNSSMFLNIYNHKSTGDRSGKASAESLKKTIHKICFWKFGPQCPTSPLLPPRKDPLEDFDLYNTYRPNPATSSCENSWTSQMHTSRNCVTNYIHKFNVIVLGRDML